MATAPPQDKGGKPWERAKVQAEHSAFRQWLMSLKGRKVVNGVGCAAATLTGVGYVVMHNWFVDNYQNIVQFYRHGLPVQVDDGLKKLKEGVLVDMGIRERFRNSFTLFYINGWEPFLIGSLKTQGGARLGIPKHYDYNSTQEVERSDILIEEKGVPWDSDDGRLLENALVLSENAKRFAIAHNAAISESKYVWLNAFTGMGSLFSYQVATVYANERFYGFLRPFSFRLVLYTVAGSLCYGVWSAIKDGYRKYLERSADKEAASLGLDYAKGGVEYYAKIIQRNIALRSLMGPGGEKLFTPVGNLNYGWLEFRQRNVPYTAKKEQLEKYVEAYLQQTSSDEF